jgi:hypothetical protein
MASPAESRAIVSRPIETSTSFLRIAQIALYPPPEERGFYGEAVDILPSLNRRGFQGSTATACRSRSYAASSSKRCPAWRA